MNYPREEKRIDMLCTIAEPINSTYSLSNVGKLATELRIQTVKTAHPVMCVGKLWLIYTSDRETSKINKYQI